jgi:hypothetical protein
MKLQDLASKPKLQKITITEPAIVDKYGEELEFFIYDRQPLDIFTKMADISKDNAGQYLTLISDIILDEKGNPICTEGNVLPLDVMTEAMKLIGEHLGK